MIAAGGISLYDVGREEDDMNEITIDAYAKINLALDVLETVFKN